MTMTRRNRRHRPSGGDPRRRTVPSVRRRGGVGPPAEPAFSEESAAPVEEPVPEESVPEEAALLSSEDYRVLMDDYKRLAADFDNYRKRQARDFNRLINQGRRQLIIELLAVLDNYDRARETLDGDHPESEIIAGLVQIGNHLESVLQKEGLSVVNTTEGDLFDPNIHEAMMAEDSPDAVADTVQQIIQKGYRLGQDLIRPVRVKVVRALRREVGETGE